MVDDPPIRKQPADGNRDGRDTFPNESYSMSQNQKRVLVAVIAILVAMIAYPPFHIVRDNGAIFNMRYGWIFDPPNKRATVNVSMLLMQWIGVLVVGVIAFFLTKGAPLPLRSSPQQSAVSTPPIEKPEEEYESLYEVFLGEKNRSYYLTKFKGFEQQALSFRDQKASWNWAAFFFVQTWALYRKTYGWAILLTGIMIIPGFFRKAGFPGWGFCLLLVPWIVFTVYANWLYHRNVKKKIAAAQRSIRDRSKFLEFLRHKGGVHKWVIWVCILLPIIGILAAIAIPQFTAYKQRGYNTAELERRPPPVTAPIHAPNLPPAPEGYKWVDVAVIAKDGRFIAYNNGTVLDTRTKLMWAAKDNGSVINCWNANSYCNHYRGGGYTDWRMPTLDELAGLYDKNKTYNTDGGYDVHLTEMIRLTHNTIIWTSETRGSESEAVSFGFVTGKGYWYSCGNGIGALPVRSGK